MATSAIRLGVRTHPRQPPTKAKLSRLILVGTAFIVAAALLPWMLMRGLNNHRSPGRFIVFSLPSSINPFGLPELEDLQILGKAIVGGTHHEPEIRTTLARLQEGLSRVGDEVPIVYVTGVGITKSSETGSRPFLLIPDGSPSGSASIPLDALFDAIGKARPSRKTLVLLDIGRIDTDRDLGVFGNEILDRLSALVQRYEHLAVLTSCAPGQLSWISEPDRRSVFGHFVAEGLGGKSAPGSAVTVRGLFSYVQPRVHDWVVRNRDGAIQTPVLLCKNGLDFTLARAPRRAEAGTPGSPANPATDPASKDEIGQLKGQIVGCWKEHEELRRSTDRFLRHAPVTWVKYEDALLHAERLFRVGDVAGIRSALRAAQQLRHELDRHAGGTPIRPWSLGMLTSMSLFGAANRPDRESIQRHHIETNEAAFPKPPALFGHEGSSRKGQPTDVPEFIEWHLPIWYRRYAEGLGNSDPLWDRRHKLLVRALSISVRGEEAAASSVRFAHWIRDAVEAGDRDRLDAQDLLFAGDSVRLDEAVAKLDAADENYRMASQIAVRCEHARGLIERVIMEVPRYGEWGARRGKGTGDHAVGMAVRLEELLFDTARLAKRLEDAGWSDGRTFELAEERLEGLIQQVEKARDAIAGDFRRDYLGVASARGPGRWRVLDALLRVPMIPAAERQGLLEAVMAPDLSPSLCDVGADIPGEPPAIGPDPAVGASAVQLARLELAILNFAASGDYEEPLTGLRKSLGASPDRPVAPAIGSDDDDDRFPRRVRALRSIMIDGIPRRLEASGSTDHAMGRNRRIADRIVRALPRAASSRPDVDVVAKLDEFDFHNLLVWHGRRLIDVSPRHALLLLERAGQLLQTAALKDARTAADGANSANIDVKLAEGGRVELAGRGILPRGRAVLLSNPGPGSPPIVGNMVPVPIAEGTALDPPVGCADGVPMVFFRGKFYSPPRPEPPPPSDSVQVEFQVTHQVAEGGLVKTGPHKVEPGTVEPIGKGLQYKLVLTNTTERQLNVCINRGMKGDRPLPPRMVKLAGNAISDVEGGFVWRADTGDAGESVLRVVISDGAAGGPPLCKPLEYRFRDARPGGRK